MKSIAQMVQLCTSKIAREKISEAVQQGSLHHIILAEINRQIGEALSSILRIEQENAIDRKPYERKVDSPKRNGFKSKSLPGFLGRIQFLLPVLRTGGVRLPLLDALRQAGSFLQHYLVQRLWLHGVSTRPLARDLNEAFGTRLSATDISTITNALEPTIRAWMEGPVPAGIEYIFLDAIYLPVRRVKFTSKQALLSALGIDLDGRCHVLGYLLGDRENIDSWKAFLRNLLDRGLRRETLRMAISDEHKAIIAAVADEFSIPHQYCLFHKVKNVRLLVAAPDRKEFMRDLHDVYWAASVSEAQRAAGVLEGKWKIRYPRAVETALRHFENYTVFFNEPRNRWRALRTNNRLERHNRELRRRLRSAGAMQTELELFKLLWGVTTAQERRWQSRKAFNDNKRPKKAA
jgi:putative transposase